MTARGNIIRAIADRLRATSASQAVSAMLKAWKMPHRPGPGWVPHVPEKGRPHFRRKAGAGGGPYLGPRGGKWADPEHTIPWREGGADGHDATANDDWLPEEHANKAPMTVDQFYSGDPKQWPMDPNKWDPKRRKLHDKIVADAFKGAKPVADGETPHVLLTMGGPGSGKSTGMKGQTQIGTPTGAVHVDPDAIKSQLPEYQSMVAAGNKDAARNAHDESSYLADRIRDEAVRRGLHAVIDGTGKNLENMTKLMRSLQDKGYHIALMYADLPMEEGLKRVAARAERTGRYVPPEVVRGAYAKIPANWDPLSKMADLAVRMDTNVPHGTAARVAEIRQMRGQHSWEGRQK